jgi:TIR domain
MIKENERLYTMTDNKEYQYDVAISFAEEDRNAALALALALEIACFKKVYYYPDKRASTWGRELSNELTKIYLHEARYVVPLLSKYYFDENKIYAKVERQAIKKRITVDPDKVFVLPIVLDSIKADKYSDLFNLGYINWDYKPKAIAAQLNEVFGKTVHAYENMKPEKKAKLLVKQILKSRGDHNINAINSVISKIIS